MLNNKTGLALALTAAISTAAFAGLPGASRHEWHFDTAANPAPGGQGAAASVKAGAFASGWLGELPELPGGSGGYWDLGSVGNISCGLSSMIPSGAAVQRITVKVTHWWDGGIYGGTLAVSLPGAQSSGPVQDLSTLGPLGGWVVDTTVLTPVTSFTPGTLTITSGANGAIVDSVVVEATTVILPPLVLEIHPDLVNPGSIELSWDAASGEAVIESSSELNNPAAWTSLSTPVQLVGGRYKVTIGAGDAAKFFRLKK